MRRPEADRYPLILTTPQVYEMLGRRIGINRLRDLARYQPSMFGVKRNGRRLLWDRDKVLAWWDRQLRYPGGQISA